MKLSDYAKKKGVSYRTAWNWWKSGFLNGEQLPSGTIIVQEGETTIKEEKLACIYARVSSSENKANLEAQLDRLTQYATVKGYKIIRSVKEVGSGLNDNRKKLASVLKDDSYNILLVEDKDRLTRFGFNYISILFSLLSKKIEVVNETDNEKDDLIADFASVIMSFCSRLYGMRRCKRKTEKIIAELQAEDETS